MTLQVALHFDDNFEARHLSVTEADGPVPPVRENTSGVKEDDSTSSTRCSY